MNIDVKKTPVYVWRSSTLPDYKINNRCIYCNRKLKLESYIGIEKQDKKLRILYEKYLSQWASIKHTDKEKEIINSIIEDNEYSIYYNNYEQNAWSGNTEDGFMNAQEYFIPSQWFCLKCGWFINGLRMGNGVGRTLTRAASLLEFDINDSNLAIPEILSHLSKKYSDIYQLSSHRFECLIAEIYANIGWHVEQTQQTRDGGIDLICLSKKNKKLLVQCKRYAKERKVTISEVDRLLGVTMRTKGNEAHLVTSSFFTAPAIKAANQTHKEIMSFKLIDAHELLSLLEVYSDSDLTLNDIKLIFNDKQNIFNEKK
jgi:hypothetical protein